MKKTLLTIISLGIIATANAATSSASNLVGFDNTTNPITDNTGTPIAAGTGYAAVGTFSADDATLQSLFTGNDYAAIQAAFTSVGSTNFGAGIGAAGLYSSGSVSQAAVSSGTIYTVLGNGSSISDSTQILIAAHSASFAADPAISDGAVLSQSATGNVDRLIVR